MCGNIPHEVEPQSRPAEPLLHSDKAHPCAIMVQIDPLFSTASNIRLSNPFPFTLMRTTPGVGGYEHL